MIDKIAMIVMLILYIIIGLASLFTYLAVRGANENKTREERFFEDLKIIENKKYSPKEALAYFVVSAKNVMNKNLESHIVSLKEEVLRNANNKQILENLNSESLEKIINYWNLSINELLAYGYIVFKNLLFEDKELTEREITDMFVYVMRLYSPSNAIECWNVENSN